MSRQIRVLFGIGALFALVMGVAVFLVMSDPDSVESSDPVQDENSAPASGRAVRVTTSPQPYVLCSGSRVTAPGPFGVAVTTNSSPGAQGGASSGMIGEATSKK